jgi:hypothetical protein
MLKNAMNEEILYVVSTTIYLVPDTSPEDPTYSTTWAGLEFTFKVAYVASLTFKVASPN